VLPDGRLVSGSRDKAIRVWDLGRGAATPVLEGHESWVTALAVLPDGRLVSGSLDQTIRVWDLARGATAQVLEGFIADTEVACLAVYDPLIVAGCRNGTVHVLSFSSAFSSPVPVRQSLRPERRSWLRSLFRGNQGKVSPFTPLP
jgi:WD40 repeat protein